MGAVPSRDIRFRGGVCEFCCLFLFLLICSGVMRSGFIGESGLVGVVVGLFIGVDVCCGVVCVLCCRRSEELFEEEVLLLCVVGSRWSASCCCVVGVAYRSLGRCCVVVAGGDPCVVLCV